MPISNPTQLVDAFKKSGEFDRLRKELLAQFQAEDSIGPLINRVEDIGRKRLETDARLKYMPQESIHRELMQELDRYPIVERAVSDVHMLSDQSFTTGIRTSLQKILRKEKGTTVKEDLKVQTSANDPPQSTIPEGPSAVRKALANAQLPVSSPLPKPDSRSQSPDSMKISSPEPSGPPTPKTAT